ncbi:MAG TPA: hypothetical protein PLL30_01620 [Candidatus Krumholzibacteria bacterium]|nr:hypothetical protein [Candidatus Krumholzibacteria bacterium]HPD70463.1 hypothetical protein [Candidatus Krumholzibacteria bacterium]HRY39837.1 hypothetical protein [Candidatus Krumholzibacteria bacterium]
MRFLFIVACLTLPAAVAAQPWCWNLDTFEVTVVDSDVKIAHHSDLINCCPDPITFDVQVGDVTIFVEEQWESPCDCDCCYDLAVVLEEVPAGWWILRYRWFDIESGGWTDRTFEVEVPDLGQGYVPVVGEIADSGCLEATAVPEEPAPARSWSALKIRFR